MSVRLPYSIPLDKRITRQPLAAFCVSCDFLTTGGGACPGAPRPAVVLSPEKPMCHSIHGDHYAGLVEVA